MLISQATQSNTSEGFFSKRRMSTWILMVIGITLVLGLPLLTILSTLFTSTSENWSHIVDHLLAEYVSNSLLIMLGVSIGVLILGVSSAWLTSMYSFPGRKYFTWLLLLPLALPAYIIAYTYTGMLDIAGPVQESIRSTLGVNVGDYWFPEIRSLGGTITMLSLVLYPYTYMLARAAFLEQSICALEVSRTLGLGSYASFFRVALPLARPAIITGLSLALMETLADYGTVQYFGIKTFTTGIFHSWIGLDDLNTAARLSSILLTFVSILIVVEIWSRKRAQYHHTSNKYSTINRIKLSGFKAILAIFICAIPVIFGFILPVLQLLYWVINSANETLNSDFLKLTFNTFILAFVTAIIATLLALFLSYSKRFLKSPVVNLGVRLSAMGYAVPGAIIAIGVMIPFTTIDNSLNTWFKQQFSMDIGLVLSGTIIALLFAYTVRFLSISIQTVESGLSKIKPSMDDAGRSLGLKPLQTLRQIHLPIMKGSALTALLLVFVEVLKELPATLILRPFNFNTLAVRAYEMAADESLADAGAPAFMIVLIGLIPVIVLSKVISNSRTGQIK